MLPDLFFRENCFQTPTQKQIVVLTDGPGAMYARL